MGRSAALAAHLPTLYREGALLGGLLDLWGVQLDLLDEAASIVQRAHWFDSTPDFDEAAALGALLDIPPETFHAQIGEYRAWVHALTDARLHGGAVTREALRILVDTYAQGFQDAADIDLVPPISAWPTAGDQPHPRQATLIENPPRLRSARLPAVNGWEPLATLPVSNAGIDPAPWAIVITGLAGGSEYAPLIANRTTGHTVVVRSQVGVGQRLTIAPTAADAGLLRADLDGHDITGALDVYPTLVPGPDGPGERAPSPVAAPLARGGNDLWLVPLAHHDTPGLDRFLLALADDDLRIGRYDRTEFDESLFAMDPQITARLTWVEREPASLEVHLPAQALRTDVDGTDAGVASRARLEVGLDAAVDRTAAAGVRTDVVLQRWSDRQPSQDRLTAIFPRTIRETGPTGADSLAEAGGIYGVTDFDDSVLR